MGRAADAIVDVTDLDDGWCMVSAEELEALEERMVDRLEGVEVDGEARVGSDPRSAVPAAVAAMEAAGRAAAGAGSGARRKGDGAKMKRTQVRSRKKRGRNKRR